MTVVLRGSSHIQKRGGHRELELIIQKRINKKNWKKLEQKEERKEIRGTRSKRNIIHLALEIKRKNTKIAILLGGGRGGGPASNISDETHNWLYWKSY
jgi:hypothetical protein